MQAEEMKEADHKYKIQLCQEVLSVLDVVEPGLRLGRGDTIRNGEKYTGWVKMSVSYNMLEMRH